MYYKLRRVVVFFKVLTYLLVSRLFGNTITEIKNYVHNNATIYSLLGRSHV